MENSTKVRSINNVIQGVDLTPDDPNFATFEQYRYFNGVRNEVPSRNKIPRSQLDPEIPSPLPKPPSKPPVIVQGVDLTPDNPDYATYQEYHYHAGIRQSSPTTVRVPRASSNLYETMETYDYSKQQLEGMTPSGGLVPVRKIVQKITLNPDHPDFQRLKHQYHFDEGTLDVTVDVQTTPIKPGLDKTPPTAIKVSAKHQSSPSTCSPSTPLPSNMLRMSRSKKVARKSCCKHSAGFTQACRVHRAVLDSKDYIQELLEVLGSYREGPHIDSLTDLTIAVNYYDSQNEKDLCPNCGGLHGRGIKKTQFQKDHYNLIEGFFTTVAEIKMRIGELFDKTEAEALEIDSIIGAANTLGDDRGEDEEGEMHVLSEELGELYKDQLAALKERMEELKKERPFPYMDDYRDPRMAQRAALIATSAAQEAELADQKIKLDKQLQDVEEARVAHLRQERILAERTPGLAARERCSNRRVAALEARIKRNDREMEEWKMKVCAMIDGVDGLEECSPMDIEFLLEVAKDQHREEMRGLKGAGDIFGSLGTKKALDRMGMEITGEFSGWNEASDSNPELPWKEWLETHKGKMKKTEMADDE